MLRGLEGWHFIILVVLIALLFGSKRLPDLARGIGQSMRIFKAEVKELKDDDRKHGASGTAATPGRPEPLEGRVVEGEPGRAGAPSEPRRDV